MARLIRHEQMGPYKIEPQDFPKDKPIWICGCGLSTRMPYCDGTHKTCRSEEPGKLYVYDLKTREVIEERPDEGPPATPRE
jgi:CDGSH-type Zn-finger protein